MTVAEAMWRFVNAWPEKPGEIGLSGLQKGGGRMMVQPLSGGVVSRRYVDGQFVAQWPFAVCVRVHADGDRERWTAAQWVDALFAWMEAAGPPALGDGRAALWLQRQSQTGLAARHADGTEEYQATFSLHYKEVGSR